MSKKEEVKKKVGIRISNSSGVAMRDVYGEGPDGGIDMKNVGDLTMHNVVGQATGGSPSKPSPMWHETLLGKIIGGIIIAVISGFLLSLFV